MILVVDQKTKKETFFWRHIIILTSKKFHSQKAADKSFSKVRNDFIKKLKNQSL